MHFPRKLNGSFFFKAFLRKKIFFCSAYYHGKRENTFIIPAEHSAPLLTSTPTALFSLRSWYVDESSEELNSWNSGGLFGCETVMRLMCANDLGALSSPSGLTEVSAATGAGECLALRAAQRHRKPHGCWTKLTQSRDGAENFVMVPVSPCLRSRLPKTPPVPHSLSSSFTDGSKFQVVFPFDFTGVVFGLPLNVMLMLNCATVVPHELQTTSRLRLHLHGSSQSTLC